MVLGQPCHFPHTASKELVRSVQVEGKPWELETTWDSQRAKQGGAEGQSCQGAMQSSLLHWNSQHSSKHPSRGNPETALSDTQAKQLKLEWSRTWAWIFSPRGTRPVSHKSL